MKIDTHVHLLVSKKQAEVDIQAINYMLDIAKTSQISALCITEHIEAIGYDNLMRALFIDNQLHAEVFHEYILTRQGIKLYPGAELQLANGTNIGVHTSLDTLLKLNHNAGAYTLEKLYDELSMHGGWFTLVAHHIFWPNKTYPDHDELARYVSAIEVPAKDLDNAEQYLVLAQKYGLATTGGSDAHTYIQIGACHSVLNDGEYGEGHPLRYAFHSNNHQYHYFSDFSKRLVEMSKIYRSTIIA